MMIETPIRNLPTALVLHIYSGDLQTPDLWQLSPEEMMVGIEHCFKWYSSIRALEDIQELGSSTEHLIFALHSRLGNRFQQNLSELNDKLHKHNLFLYLNLLLSDLNTMDAGNFSSLLNCLLTMRIRRLFIRIDNTTPIQVSERQRENLQSLFDFFGEGVSWVGPPSAWLMTGLLDDPKGRFERFQILNSPPLTALDLTQKDNLVHIAEDACVLMLNHNGDLSLHDGNGSVNELGHISIASISTYLDQKYK